MTSGLPTRKTTTLAHFMWRANEHVHRANQTYQKNLDSLTLVDRNNLNDEFWNFSRDWIRRVVQKIENGSSDFEGFIYLWIVFNGWASQIITNEEGYEQDAYLVASLGIDDQLNKTFEDLKVRDIEFGKLTSEFSSMLPVFKVRVLRGKNINSWDGVSPRKGYVKSVFDQLGKNPRNSFYAPPCYLNHQGTIPNDWAHTLSTIYKVRCNLFHGGKTFNSSGDIRFVSSAFQILWRVWKTEIPRHTIENIGDYLAKTKLRMNKPLERGLS